MARQSKIKQYRTRVGRAIMGDNLFRGHRVSSELVGKRDFWQAMSLAIDGPELTPFQCDLFDVMTTAGLAADPRIWPLKTIRVTGAYGQMWSALSSAFLLTDGTSVGPSRGAATAKLFARIEALGQESPALSLDAIVAQVAEEHGGRLPGFGVAGREVDERYLAIAKWFEHHCPEGYDLHFWRLCHEVQPVVERLYGLKANLMTCMVSLFLDMGFEAEHMPCLVFLPLLPCFFANAYEGALVDEARLPERLDTTSVTYVGRPARHAPDGASLDPG